MSTNTHDQQFRQVLVTLLLGLAMAAGIWLFAGPSLSWLGFAMAGILGSGTGRPACLPRRSGG